jgi:hypothetical protein
VTGDDLREAVAKLNATKTATIKVSSKVAARRWERGRK